jgi:hypothetical protein
MLQSLATRVPKIILKRVEEIFPPLKESFLSFCACMQRRGLYSLVISDLLNPTKLVVYIEMV